MYTIKLLDAQGCDMATCETESLKAAKDTARAYLNDPEYRTDAHKAEVLNQDLTCVWDQFVPAPSLTLRQAQQTLRAIGITLVKRDSEYIVKHKGDRVDAPRTYFTNDIRDALDTGRAMVARLADTLP